MTAYQFRLLTAGALFALLVFAVMAFGAVDTWALAIFELGVFTLTAACVLRLALTGQKPVWNRFYIPLAFLIVWTTGQWALGWSVNVHQTGAEARKWLSFGLVYALACQCFTDLGIRRKFRLALVGFSCALCVFALAQFFSSPQMLYWSIPLLESRAFGPFVDRNHFAAFMELVVPAALWLALRPSEQRLIYVVVYGLMVSSVAISGSRAGAILVGVQTIIVLLGTVVARKGRASSRAGTWLPLAGVAAAAAFSLAVAGSQTLASRFEEERPYELRWRIVVASWNLFAGRPWTGYGAGTFGQVYPSGAPFDTGAAWTHAHNDPVQFAVEWGAPGILFLASLLGLLVARRWPMETWLRVVLPVVTVLVHSWFEFPLQIPAVITGWLLTLAHADPGQSRAASRVAPAAEPGVLA